MESQTPDDLEMENEDVVHALQNMVGDIGVFEVCDATRSDHGILVGMTSNIAPPAEAVSSIATQHLGSRQSLALNTTQTQLLTLTARQTLICALDKAYHEARCGSETTTSDIKIDLQGELERMIGVATSIDWWNILPNLSMRSNCVGLSRGAKWDKDIAFLST